MTAPTREARPVVKINWWSGRQESNLSDILRTPEARRVLGMSEREPWMPTIAEMAEVAKRYRSHKVEALIRRAARLRAIEELEKVRGRAASTINDRIAQLRAEEERRNDG